MNREQLLDQLAAEIFRAAPHAFENAYDMASLMMERRRVILEQWNLQDANRDGWIESLGLDNRSERCLMAEDIRAISQLIDRTENELLKTPNLGRKSLNQIKDKLAARGLKLKDPMKDWHV
jgi:DNA-directed RNA polymerase alpha subunit